MKIYALAAVAVISSSAYADEVANRIAYQRSVLIADAIKAGEADLKKAVEYGDDKGYRTSVQGPLVRKLQWWREFGEKYPEEFKPYAACLSAGVHYVRYGESFWDTPSLERDRTRVSSQKDYLRELKDCRASLKAHPASAI